MVVKAKKPISFTDVEHVRRLTNRESLLGGGGGGRKEYVASLRKALDGFMRENTLPGGILRRQPPMGLYISEC